YHGVTGQRREERRPAAVGREFALATEELGAAPPAPVDALGGGLVVFPGERALRPRLPEDLVLLGGQAATPLRVVQGEVRVDGVLISGAAHARRLRRWCGRCRRGDPFVSVRGRAPPHEHD